MAKAEPVQPVSTPNVFRENLAGLQVQRRKAEQLRDEKIMELAEARLVKHSAEAQLADIQKKIGWVKNYNTKPTEEPAYIGKAMVSMGGQYWDLRANQDGAFEKPEEKIPTAAELASLPPLKQLEDAERDAISANYAADFKIGALEAMQAEAVGLVSKTDKAISATIAQIVLPEIPFIQSLCRTSSAEQAVQHRAVLRFLAQSFRNPFGPDVQQVDDANKYLNRTSSSEDWSWASNPAVVPWCNFINTLRIDATVPVPEVK